MDNAITKTFWELVSAYFYIELFSSMTFLWMVWRLPNFLIADLWQWKETYVLRFRETKKRALVLVLKLSLFIILACGHVGVVPHGILTPGGACAPCYTLLSYLWGLYLGWWLAVKGAQIIYRTQPDPDVFFLQLRRTTYFTVSGDQQSQKYPPKYSVQKNVENIFFNHVTI